MNKLIYILFAFVFFLIPFSFAGAAAPVELNSPYIEPDIFLKADPSEIIYTKEIDNYDYDKDTKELKLVNKLIRYDYISNEETTEKIIFKDGQVYSNTELIYQVDQTSSVKFYGKPMFYKGNEGIYKIKTAYISTEGYKSETDKKTFLKPFFDYFMQPAHAADYYEENGYGSILKLSNDSWANAHDAITGGGVCVDPNCYVGAEYYNGSWVLYRYFSPFDTSAIPNGATIDSAVYYFSVHSVAQNHLDEYSYLTLTESTQASYSELTTADFDAITFNELNDVGDREDINGIATNQYIYIELNATGRAVVDDEGYTQLALLIGDDMQDVAYNGANTYTEPLLDTGTDATYPPYLEIVYTEDEKPTEPVWNVASTSTLIGATELPIILIIFVGLFLLILVFGNRLIIWFKTILYDRY